MEVIIVALITSIGPLIFTLVVKRFFDESKVRDAQAAVERQEIHVLVNSKLDSALAETKTLRKLFMETNAENAAEVAGLREEIATLNLDKSLAEDAAVKIAEGVEAVQEIHAKTSSTPDEESEISEST